MSYIVLAIPVFLFFVLLEIVVDHLKKTNYYRFNDTINSLSVGSLSRVMGIALAFTSVGFYLELYENHSFYQTSPDNFIVWVLAFLSYDFCYYWYHRYSHEVNVFWSSHVVHHQSEEYNLSTALRQTGTSRWFSWIFYLPLAVLGLNPKILAGVGAFNLIYQFFVHTQFVGKLPRVIEYIFVTPSNHGVHHGQNRIYIDKNYAGVFILWDRLFGTYQEETEKPIYGVRKPLNSWNPFWANFDHYYDLFEDALHTKSWKNKFLIWFKPTGWRPKDTELSHPRKYTNLKNLVKFDIELSFLSKAYISLQFVMLLGLSIWFIYSAKSLNFSDMMACSIGLILSYISLSLIQEGKGLGYPLELLRLIATAVFVIFYIHSTWVLITVSLLSITSVVMLINSHRTLQMQTSHIKKLG